VVTLATRDNSYARDVRRLLRLTPMQRLEQSTQLARAAQSTRRAAVEGTTVRDRAALRSPPPEQRATLVMSAERHGNWQDWPFDPLHVLRAFADAEVEYVLVGGLAAVLQGSPIPTYDIEMVPAPGKRNRARLLAALAALDGISLTDVDDVDQALAESTDLAFTTPSGHIDVHHGAPGFTGHRELRRCARAITLEPGLVVQALSLRDIIRSRMAAGSSRHLPALETVLELSRP